MNNFAELEFAIFCIENVAIELNVSASDVFSAFTEKSNILYGYIVPSFEILHTQSKDYIVEDIINYMKEIGVEL